MTLFARAAPAEPVFRQVLDRYFGGVPDSATEPHRLLDDSLIKARIDDCMRELTSAQRQALALAYYRGMVHAEIAESIGALDTAGGVVFSGSIDRYFRAFDDQTGKQLWEVRLADVPRPHTAAQAELGFIAAFDHLLDVGERNGGDHRTKYLLLRDAHVVTHIGGHRRWHEIAFR